MVLIIGLGSIIVMLLGRLENVITARITTAVIMVVAALGPASLRWTIPPLRLLDAMIGILEGIGCWWIWNVLFVFHDQREKLESREWCSSPLPLQHLHAAFIEYTLPPSPRRIVRSWSASYGEKHY